MPPLVQVPGLASVYIDYGSGLTLLGYTRNGADTTKEAFHHDVPGDANGGDQGPPIDIIYLGEIGRVRLELTKWDEVVANAVRARIRGATAGTPATPGTLIMAGTLFFRVCINSPNNPRNFLACVCRAPIEMNRGTKFATLILEFEAHKHPSSGILYNAATG